MQTTQSPKSTELTSAAGITSAADHTNPEASVVLDADRVRRMIGKRSFATLATTSAAGFPHVAGVLYELVGDHLYVNTLRSSRKARNIATNPRAAVCVPVRRLPVGPPSTIQFQATAALLDYTDDEVTDLLAQGHLGSLTAHGELDLPDGCFVRISPRSRVRTHGLGMSLRSLIGDPISAGGSAPFEAGR